MNKYLVKDIHDACARNSNLRAKPNSSDMKFGLTYKCVFADFLYLAPRHYGRMRRMQLAQSDKTQVVSLA